MRFPKGWPATVLATVVALVLLVVVAVLAVIFTGAYNVAATRQHWPVTEWALDRLQESSVAARAEAIEARPRADSASLAHGFEHFHAMCVHCHGAPGMERGEFGQGLTPTPPRLEEAARQWSDAELFWITKYGIRLAGMPAFGPTHGDAELWAIVGFLRQLEDMSATEYAERVAELTERTGGDPAAAGHSHPPGTPPHEH